MPLVSEYQVFSDKEDIPLDDPKLLYSTIIQTNDGQWHLGFANSHYTLMEHLGFSPDDVQGYYSIMGAANGPPYYLDRMDVGVQENWYKDNWGSKEQFIFGAIEDTPIDTTDHPVHTYDRQEDIPVEEFDWYGSAIQAKTGKWYVSKHENHFGLLHALGWTPEDVAGFYSLRDGIPLKRLDVGYNENWYHDNWDQDVWKFSATDDQTDELHVGLDIPEEQRQQIKRWVDTLDWPEGTELTPPEEYHITVMYAPTGHAEHKDADWIEHADGHDVTVTGVEEFESDEKEELNAQVLRLDAPTVKEHADRLQSAAKDQGLEISEYPGGFKPHLTVAYAPAPVNAEGAPALSFRTGPSSISTPRGLSKEGATFLGKCDGCGRTSAVDFEPNGERQLCIACLTQPGWNIRRAAEHKLHWTEGSHGKGLAFNNDGEWELHTWNVDNANDGQPWHSQYLRNQFGRPNIIPDAAWLIHPDGTMAFHHGEALIPPDEFAGTGLWAPIHDQWHLGSREWLTPPNTDPWLPGANGRYFELLDGTLYRWTDDFHESVVAKLGLGPGRIKRMGYVHPNTGEPLARDDWTFEGSVASHRHVTKGHECHCSFGYHLQKRKRIAKTSAKLDWLKQRREQGDKWLNSHDGREFMNWALSEGPDWADPILPWVAREVKKGRMVIDRTGWPHASDSRENGGYSLNHLADWFKSDSLTRKGIDIMQLNAQQVRDKLNEWDEELASKMEEEQGNALTEGGEVVHQWDDGWTVRRLTEPEHLEAEGDAMGHCVGGYADMVQQGETLIYSLRDPQGKPHATWEVRPDPNGDWQPAEDWIETAIVKDPVGRAMPTELQQALRHYNSDRWINNASMVKDEKYGPYTGEQMEPVYNTLYSKYADLVIGPEGGQVVQIQGKQNEEPKDEYKARIKDWFTNAFDDHERPIASSDSYINDVAHLRPDWPAYDHVPNPERYGLEDARLVDWGPLVDSIAWAGTEQRPVNPDDAQDVYELARQRGAIPELASAAQSLQEKAWEDFHELENMNHEYLGVYPGESWEESNGLFETKEEWDKAHQQYEQARDELERSHGPSKATNYLYEHLNNHWDPQVGQYVNTPSGQKGTFSSWQFQASEPITVEHAHQWFDVPEDEGHEGGPPVIYYPNIRTVSVGHRGWYHNDLLPPMQGPELQGHVEGRLSDSEDAVIWYDDHPDLPQVAQALGVEHIPPGNLQEQAGQWFFSNAEADTYRSPTMEYGVREWKPGSVGKGFVTPDDQIVAWSINGNDPWAGPHHREVAGDWNEDMLPFQIESDGQASFLALSDWIHDADLERFKRVIDKHPYFYFNEDRAEYSDEWRFASQPHQLMWEPGHEGKALVTKDGVVHTWKVDGIDGQPSHIRYAEQKGLDDGGMDYIWDTAAWISPTGELAIYDNQWGPYKPDSLDLLMKADPRLKYNNISANDVHEHDSWDTWNFSKTAAAPWFSPSYVVPPEAAQQIYQWAQTLPWPEGSQIQPPDKYHITAFYSPQGYDDYDNHGWLAPHAEASFPVRAKGLEQFTPGHSPMLPIVLTFDAPQMSAHAEQLMNEAEQRGLAPSRFPGGHKPHITIGKTPVPMDLSQPVPPITFNTDGMFETHQHYDDLKRQTASERDTWTVSKANRQKTCTREFPAHIYTRGETCTQVDKIADVQRDIQWLRVPNVPDWEPGEEWGKYIITKDGKHYRFTAEYEHSTVVLELGLYQDDIEEAGYTDETGQIDGSGQQSPILEDWDFYVGHAAAATPQWITPEGLEPWEEGKPGKGMTLTDGQTLEWATNSHLPLLGAPHHHQVAPHEHLIEHAWDIRPDGTRSYAYGEGEEEDWDFFVGSVETDPTSEEVWHDGIDWLAAQDPDLSYGQYVQGLMGIGYAEHEAREYIDRFQRFNPGHFEQFTARRRAAATPLTQGLNPKTYRDKHKTRDANEGNAANRPAIDRVLGNSIADVSSNQSEEDSSYHTESIAQLQPGDPGYQPHSLEPMKRVGATPQSKYVPGKWHKWVMLDGEFWTWPVASQDGGPAHFEWIGMNFEEPDLVKPDDIGWITPDGQVGAEYHEENEKLIADTIGGSVRPGWDFTAGASPLDPLDCESCGQPCQGHDPSMRRHVCGSCWNSRMSRMSRYGRSIPSAPAPISRVRVGDHQTQLRNAEPGQGKLYVGDWTPGQNGKWVVTDSGDVHVWPVDELGQPHHEQYLRSKGMAGPGKGQAWLRWPQGIADTHVEQLFGRNYATHQVAEQLGLPPRVEDWTFSHSQPRISGPSFGLGTPRWERGTPNLHIAPGFAKDANEFAPIGPDERKARGLWSDGTPVTPWQPGVYGKLIVTSDGTAHAWESFDDPSRGYAGHHIDHPNFDEAAIWGYIDPDGKYRGQRYDRTIPDGEYFDYMQGIAKQIPGSKWIDANDWDFSGSHKAGIFPDEEEIGLINQVGPWKPGTHGKGLLYRDGETYTLHTWETDGFGWPHHADFIQAGRGGPGVIVDWLEIDKNGEVVAADKNIQPILQADPRLKPRSTTWSFGSHKDASDTRVAGEQAYYDKLIQGAVNTSDHQWEPGTHGKGFFDADGTPVTWTLVHDGSYTEEELEEMDIWRTGPHHGPMIRKRFGENVYNEGMMPDKENGKWHTPFYIEPDGTAKLQSRFWDDSDYFTDESINTLHQIGLTPEAPETDDEEWTFAKTAHVIDWEPGTFGKWLVESDGTIHVWSVHGDGLSFDDDSDGTPWHQTYMLDNGISSMNVAAKGHVNREGEVEDYAYHWEHDVYNGPSDAARAVAQAIGGELADKTGIGWDFTSAIHQRDWELGSYGKGVITEDGTAHIWSVPEYDGQPEHSVYMKENNLGGFDFNNHTYLTVNPNGKRNIWMGATTPEHEQAFHEAVPEATETFCKGCYNRNINPDEDGIYRCGECNYTGAIEDGQDQWTFSKTAQSIPVAPDVAPYWAYSNATIEPWEPGVTGKGMYMKDGSLRLWRTDIYQNSDARFDGHHVSHPEYGQHESLFWVDPDGTLQGNSAYRDQIVALEPRLQKLSPEIRQEIEQWKFADAGDEYRVDDTLEDWEPGYFGKGVIDVGDQVHIWKCSRDGYPTHGWFEGVPKPINGDSWGTAFHVGKDGTVQFWEGDTIGDENIELVMNHPGITGHVHERITGSGNMWNFTRVAREYGGKLDKHPENVDVVPGAEPWQPGLVGKGLVYKGKPYIFAEIAGNPIAHHFQALNALSGSEWQWGQGVTEYEKIGVEYPLWIRGSGQWASDEPKATAYWSKLLGDSGEDSWNFAKTAATLTGNLTQQPPDVNTPPGQQPWQRGGNGKGMFVEDQPYMWATEDGKPHHFQALNAILGEERHTWDAPTEYESMGIEHTIYVNDIGRIRHFESYATTNAWVMALEGYRENAEEEKPGDQWAFSKRAKQPVDLHGGLQHTPGNWGRGVYVPRLDKIVTWDYRPNNDYHHHELFFDNSDEISFDDDYNQSLNFIIQPDGAFTVPNYHTQRDEEMIQTVYERTGLRPKGVARGNMYDQQMQWTFGKTAYDESAESKWIWVEGFPVEEWRDTERGGTEESRYEKAMKDQGLNTNQRDVAWEDGSYTDYGGTVAHFEKLVEYAMKHPELQNDPTLSQYEGESYMDIPYGDVAEAYDENGVKWAIGTFNEGMHPYERVAQLGAKSEYVELPEIERQIGAKLVNFTWDEDAGDVIQEGGYGEDVYGLDQQWVFSNRGPKGTLTRSGTGTGTTLPLRTQKLLNTYYASVKTAHQHNWEPGSHGKGLIEVDGTIHTWSTDARRADDDENDVVSGSPHHSEYAMDFGLGSEPLGLEEDSGWHTPFYIHPNGNVQHLGWWPSAEHESLEQLRPLGLTPIGTSSWDFTASSDLHHFVPEEHANKGGGWDDERIPFIYHPHTGTTWTGHLGWWHTNLYDHYLGFDADPEAPAPDPSTSGHGYIIPGAGSGPPAFGLYEGDMTPVHAQSYAQALRERLGQDIQYQPEDDQGWLFAKVAGGIKIEDHSVEPFQSLHHQEQLEQGAEEYQLEPDESIPWSIFYAPESNRVVYGNEWTHHVDLNEATEGEPTRYPGHYYPQGGYVEWLSASVPGNHKEVQNALREHSGYEWDEEDEEDDDEQYWRFGSHQITWTPGQYGKFLVLQDKSVIAWTLDDVREGPGAYDGFPSHADKQAELMDSGVDVAVIDYGYISPKGEVDAVHENFDAVTEAIPGTHQAYGWIFSKASGGLKDKAINAILGEPVSIANDWNTPVKPWQAGQPGKGLVWPDGTMHLWKTDFGHPHHNDAFTQITGRPPAHYLKPNQEEYQELRIHEDGTVFPAGTWKLKDYAKQAIEAHPDLHHRDSDDPVWDFNASAAPFQVELDQVLRAVA
jgi:2'-5' RNA ligase